MCFTVVHSLKFSLTLQGISPLYFSYMNFCFSLLFVGLRATEESCILRNFTGYELLQESLPTIKISLSMTNWQPQDSMKVNRNAQRQHGMLITHIIKTTESVVCISNYNTTTAADGKYSPAYWYICISLNCVNIKELWVWRY